MSVSLLRIKDTLPACIAVGLVDLQTGALLETCADFDAAADHLARGCAAALTLLESPDARAVAATVSRASARAGARASAGTGERPSERAPAPLNGAGAGADDAFQEVVLRAGDLVYVLQRRREQGGRCP